MTIRQKICSRSPKPLRMPAVKHDNTVTKLKSSKATRYLTDAFALRTSDRIEERDSLGELEGWFREIGKGIDPGDRVASRSTSA